MPVAASLLAGVLDRIGDIIIALDREWRFAYLNRFALERAGKPAKALLGRSLWEVYPQLVGTIFEKHYRQAMAEQAPSRFESRGILTGRWQEVYLYPSAEVLVILGRDIQDRKLAEERLRESEACHRLISDLTSDYNFCCRVGPDDSLLLEWATPGFTAVTGYTVEEINAAGGWAWIVHPEDREVLARRGRAWIRAGQRVINEIRMLTKTGEPRWIRYAAQPVRDPEGGPVVRVLGAAQDITAYRQAEQRAQEYARRLLEVQEHERRHLARELHDQIGQELTALHFLLQASLRSCGETQRARLEESEALARALMGRVRELSLDLRPSMLDDLGLAPALQWLCQRLTAQTPVRACFECSESAGRLHPQVETAAYRIVQEALTNVVRHAGPCPVTVRLRQDEHRVAIEIEDGGSGFDPASARLAQPSSGLSSMHERATLLGGQLHVHSEPGSGTRVRAELPTHPAS
ncbi:MAG TPA: PAS domain-containing protein [Gemmataceae bacterium]|nr:PAS domain-containing protein [Gemmataceae bacterium]